MAMYVDYRHFRTKHPDLAAFHRRRYEVYTELLGIDLEQPVESQHLHGLLNSFADASRRLESPFANYLEAPEDIITVYQTHGHQISQTFDGLKTRYLDVMVDCAERVWGPCPRTVTDEDLRLRGVGRADEPDEFDYW